MKNVAIVTGGTGALGDAVVRRLADAGFEVHATSQKESREKGVATVHAVDLADLGAARSFAAKFGEVHALALCAGAYAGGELAGLTAESLDDMLRANLKTAAHTLGAFAGKLAAGAGAVLLGSQAYDGAAGSAAYAASKAAVVSLARSASLEWRARGVRVNAVLPDTMDTPANRRAMPDADFDRWAKPEEVAEVIAWLCSPGAKVVSGNAIRVGR